MIARLVTLRNALTAFWVAAMLVAAPVPSGAQSATMDDFNRRLTGRVDDDTRRQVLGIAADAVARGLPADAIITKALHGASSRAAGPKIVRVVEQYRDRLDLARVSLGGRAESMELVAGAEALFMGVPGDILGQIRRSQPGGNVTIALAVTTDLVKQNVPVDVASRAVLALASGGLSDAQLIDVRKSIERDIELGTLPATATSLRVFGTADATSGSVSLRAGFRQNVAPVRAEPPALRRP